MSAVAVAAETVMVQHFHIAGHSLMVLDTILKSQQMLMSNQVSTVFFVFFCVCVKCHRIAVGID